MSVPGFNASMNFISAICLAIGFVCVRRRQVHAHRAFMAAALAASVIFLISYVLYHWHAGHVRYAGLGWRRTVYLSILSTHTCLALVILPLVLRTWLLAIQRRWDAHRRLARWTLPLWFYVSVTGVVIYEMLY